MKFYTNRRTNLQMNPIRESDLMMTRRQLFGRAALGLGTAALANVLGPDLLAKGQAPGTHFAPKAKRVIYLFMSGGPSHHDLWDYKPKMREMFGKDLPEHVRDGQRITGMTSRQKRFRSARANTPSPNTKTTSAACGLANCCRTPPRSPRNSRWFTARSPRRSTMTRRSRTSKLAARFPADRAWAPG